MSLDLEAMLAEHDAILRGHFALASGRHSSVYFQMARLLAIPAAAWVVGAELARLFREAKVESVIAPALGGVVLSHVVAQALDVPSYFVERVEGEFALRRGFRLRKGERVLVVEDVLTTGGSARAVVQLVARLEAAPVGIGALVNRGEVASDGPPIRALLSVTAPLYAPKDCPLCRDGVPCVKPGSG